MFYSILEWSATSLSVLYLWLLIRRNILCWPFGIISSLLSIALFVQVKLYSEAILYFFYVVFGIYGWYNWSKQNAKQEDGSIKIQQQSLMQLAAFSILSALLALAVGYFWENYSDASFPYLDAQTTLFALFATWLEARRVFEGWFFWIVINALSSGIYAIKGLPVYSVLMIFYTFMSIYGWWSWRKTLIQTKQSTN